MATRRRVTLVKLGGELLETPEALRRVARALVRLATRDRVIVVHGGGREVTAEMSRLGLEKRAVDGLRITDAPTLDVVLGVLAGRVNPRLVAALGVAGASAVGLTGVDAGVTRVRRARRYRAVDGSSVDLGFVGIPVAGEPPALLRDLLRGGHLPVVASLGADARGQIYNVNADTLAGDLAPRVGAHRLVIAGTTAGVLDEHGRTVPEVDDPGLRRLVAEGHASAGMIAKLHACRAARAQGVPHVVIANGTRRGFLDTERPAGSTTVTASGR